MNFREELKAIDEHYRKLAQFNAARQGSFEWLALEQNLFVVEQPDGEED
jgi:hypothetical protein